MQRAIPCTLMRGGTSKGVIIRAEDLPADAAARDRVILALFGSPDARQVDGLGGADPLTSKVVVVAPSLRPDADVEYTFGQVAIEKAEVGYANNCGNMAAAVGPWAIDAGLVEAREPFTTVRLYNLNSAKRIIARVPVKERRALTEGECRIDGVPGAGAEISMTFCDPGGAVTGRLLPFGEPTTSAVVAGVSLDLSVVDCGTLYAFLDAAALGLSGTESPGQIEQRADVLGVVDGVRQVVSGRLLELGLASREKADALRSGLKVAVVGAAAGDVDVNARIVNPGKVHRSFAVTGAIAIAAAAALPGTIVRALCPGDGPPRKGLTVGHPQGGIEVGVETGTARDGGIEVRGVTVARTARRLMDGLGYVPGSVWTVGSKGMDGSTRG
jgi:hypothetical protein